MATTAKKLNPITLGPTKTDRDKEIALQELATRLNQIIESLNQVITDLNV